MFAGENKREKIIVLLTMCFALFMAMLDNTVVNVALPTIQLKLRAGFSALQWIVDGYVLAFASLLLTGGILGDRYGRKRMFLSGLALFTLASAGCGLSGSASMLIAFRALQGVGGAMLIPGTLSILTVTFPPQERAQALGIWAGVSGIALALGPTLGGYLVDHVGWQSVFFLNIPIGIAGFIVATRVVRESHSEFQRRLDFGGLALGTLALVSLTFGIIEANDKGWRDPLIVATLIGFVVFSVAFLMWERRSDHAMLPLALFRVPAFAAGNAIAFAISLGMFGTFFFMALYMQQIRGYRPFSAGLRLLPLTVMIIVVAPNAGRLASKYGSRWPMTFGLTMAGSGLLLMTRLTVGTPYILMVPVMMIMGIGMASTIAPMTAAVMNSVGPQRAGLGSAMTNTSREVGGVFGIALLGTLLTTKMKASLGAAAGLGIEQRRALAAAAGHTPLPYLVKQLGAQGGIAISAWMDGFRLALTVGGMVLLVAAFVAYRFIPGTPASAHAPGDAEVVPAH